jgi:hypothetical protein
MVTRPTLYAPAQQDTARPYLEHTGAAVDDTRWRQHSIVLPTLPDEALISVVGRFHILSSNRTTSSTYRELFNCAPFNLSAWIPPHVELLAQRLGGNLVVQTSEILRANTLLPLLIIFNGISSQPLALQNAVASTPKRSAMEPVRLCLRCLRQDMEILGVRYIHRSHQVPGVERCSKHGTALLYKCPFCECLVGRHNELVLTPWRQCACKKYIFDALETPAQSEDSFALSYAKFAEELLLAPTSAVPPHTLVECYRKRAREIGFGWGSSQVSRAQLMPEIEKFYGRAFLSRVDAAYREERLSDWFKMLSDSSVTEPPLGRHLLFAHFLFREAAQFWASLREFGDIDQTSAPEKQALKRRKTSAAKAAATSKPSLEQRVADLIHALINRARGIPQCSVEDLWKSKYGVMKRLVSLDPDAIDDLRRKLKNIKPKPPISKNEPSISQKDDELARTIREKAATWYSSAEKPERVTINRLIRDLGWNPYARSPYTFPQAKQALEESTESNWHFYARRIIWAKLSYRYASDAVIKHKSGTEHHRGVVLMTFFQDVELSTPLLPGTITALLTERGIHRDWTGPCPEREFPPAGRRFYQNK